MENTLAKDLTRNAVIKRIKKALEARSGVKWSVTGGRGTAYGWITIDAPPSERTWRFREEGRDEMTGLPKYVEYEDASSGFGHMSPARRILLAELLGFRFRDKKIHHQGESIPASSAYYEEYIDRAEGRTPSRCGEQYWD